MFLVGISPKDRTTLRRFENRGYTTWALDPVKDLGLSIRSGVESIQAHLCKENAERYVNEQGKADLVIARHIWEHVANQNEFSAALKELTSDEGYLLFEVPDCSDLVKSCDYTMPWEEHLYYYDPATLRKSLQSNGFDIVRMDVVPQPYENLLIAICRKRAQKRTANSQEKDSLVKAKKQGELYAKNYHRQKSLISSFLRAEKKRRRTVLFGGGHSSCSFINYFDIGGMISSVVDDDTNKQGLYMPKSKTPIVESSVLNDKIPTLCLLAINPAHEENIMTKFRDSTAGSCKFLSIIRMNKKFLLHNSLLYE